MQNPLHRHRVRIRVQRPRQYVRPHRLGGFRFWLRRPLADLPHPQQEGPGLLSGIEAAL